MAENESVGFSILIIARPSRLRDSLQAILRSFPHVMVVEPADDGPAALETIARRLPSLILLDADLPNGEGWYTLKQLHREGVTSPCIVMVSGTEQERMARAAGASAVLTKGFPAADLDETMSTLLVTH